VFQIAVSKMKFIGNLFLIIGNKKAPGS